MLRSRVLLTIDPADRLGSRLWAVLGNISKALLNLSLVISTLWIICLTRITWRRFYQVGVLITRLNRNTSHVELEVFATWDFFFCMNIYRWLLCWSLNIDIAYNQDPESCANISPNSRHRSLIFCYSNFHHGFIFSFWSLFPPLPSRVGISMIFLVSFVNQPHWIRLFYLSMPWLFDSQRDLFLCKKWGIFTAIPSYPYVKRLMVSQSIEL